MISRFSVSGQRAYQVSTVRVEFTTKVTRLDVDVGAVDEPSELKVLGGLYELETSDGALGNETTTMLRRAPGNFFTLGVGNDVHLLGSP